MNKNPRKTNQIKPPELFEHHYLDSGICVCGRFWFQLTFGEVVVPCLLAAALPSLSSAGVPFHLAADPPCTVELAALSGHIWSAAPISSSSSVFEVGWDRNNESVSVHPTSAAPAQRWDKHFYPCRTLAAGLLCPSLGDQEIQNVFPRLSRCRNTIAVQRERFIWL